MSAQNDVQEVIPDPKFLFLFTCKQSGSTATTTGAAAVRESGSEIIDIYLNKGKSMFDLIRVHEQGKE
jgi:hypothetical protein